MGYHFLQGLFSTFYTHCSGKVDFHFLFRINCINSSLAEALDANKPFMEEVTITLFCLPTPRIRIHMWVASITQAAARGFKISIKAVVTWSPILSWIWARLAYISTKRANLLMPITFSPGMYATWATPKKGSK